MSTQPFGPPGMSPFEAFRLIAVVVTLGVVTVLAASVDPWLLVVLAGLAVTLYAIYDRTGDDWVLTI